MQKHRLTKWTEQHLVSIRISHGFCAEKQTQDVCSGFAAMHMTNMMNSQSTSCILQVQTPGPVKITERLEPANKTVTKLYENEYKSDMCRGTSAVRSVKRHQGMF